MANKGFLDHLLQAGRELASQGQGMAERGAPSPVQAQGVVPQHGTVAVLRHEDRIAARKKAPEPVSLQFRIQGFGVACGDSARNGLVVDLHNPVKIGGICGSDLHPAIH